MTMQHGQFVRITGGVSDRGKVGQVSDLSEPGWVGVRIPNNKTAKATTYVTNGSVEPVSDGETAPEGK